MKDKLVRRFNRGSLSVTKGDSCPHLSLMPYKQWLLGFDVSEQQELCIEQVEECG